MSKVWNFVIGGLRLKLIFDIFYHKSVIGLGVDSGSNHFYNEHAKNFFLELTLLCWVIGLEISWKFLNDVSNP